MWCCFGCSSQFYTLLYYWGLMAYIYVIQQNFALTNLKALITLIRYCQNLLYTQYIELGEICEGSKGQICWSEIFSTLGSVFEHPMLHRHSWFCKAHDNHDNQFITNSWLSTMHPHGSINVFIICLPPSLVIFTYISNCH